MGKKVGAQKKPAGIKPPKPVVPRTTVEANWAKSYVTLKKLNKMVADGILPPQDEIKWRAPGEETRPEPKEGEIIVFADHVTRGFRPPGSKFFRSVLHCYQLHLQVLSANSVLNICHLQVFCEAYFQIKPTLSLFT